MANHYLLFRKDLAGYLKPLKSILLLLIATSCINVACNNEAESNKVSENNVAAIQKKYSPELLYLELKRRANENSTSAKSDTVLPPVPQELQNISTDSLYHAYNSYQKANYGLDDRFNYYEADSAFQKNAEKVFCMIFKKDLRLINDSTYQIIPTGLLGEIKGLCDDQNFVHEPVAAFCSGFAVSANTVVTAGHCVLQNHSLNEYFIVYDFRMSSKLKPQLTISRKNVFEIEKVVNASSLNSEEDVAVLRIKGTIPKERIPVLSKKNNLEIGLPIYAIGYPNGLPVKIAENAVVINNKMQAYYVTNLDTYGGNSGSPVFNRQDHCIEGMLVRGNSDFTYVKLTNCYAAIKCPETIGTCSGEDVTRISRIIRILTNLK